MRFAEVKLMNEKEKEVAHRDFEREVIEDRDIADDSIYYDMYADAPPCYEE